MGFTFDALLNIVEQFDIEGKVVSIEKYGEGHINNTFLVITDKKRYVLQRMNTNVFKNIDVLMNNMYKVTTHLKNRGVETLNMVLLKDGRIYLNGEDNFRLCDFIENTITFQQVDSPETFKKVGEAFAVFQKYLADFDATELVDTIPLFHYTPKRFNDFMQAVSQNLSNRKDTCLDEINFVLDREKDYSVITNAIALGEVPLRVTHNDTKLNNVLMDETGSHGRAVIDLDTVMQGSLLYDFGDSIRFGASTAKEDEKDLDKVHFDINLFKAYAEGFCPPLKDVFTKAEKDLLPYGAYIMTMECGMRFLGDYLNGDTYFATKYPEHNLVRCRTQFRLAKEMQEQMSDMKKIINDILK